MYRQLFVLGAIVVGMAFAGKGIESIPKIATKELSRAEKAGDKIVEGVECLGNFIGVGGPGSVFYFKEYANPDHAIPGCFKWSYVCREFCSRKLVEDQPKGLQPPFPPGPEAEDCDGNVDSIFGIDFENKCYKGWLKAYQICAVYPDFIRRPCEEEGTTTPTGPI
jgi:hypothetical protein